MANLRILYNNAIDRQTGIATTSSAGTLVATNLLTDLKSEVWRSTTTTETITVNWSTGQTISCLVLPFTNLTATSTIRVRGYTLPGDATPVLDTGAVLASPAGFFGNPGDWGSVPLGTNSFIYGGVNSFAYGGGTTAYLYFTPTVVSYLVVDIVDGANTMGYIEVSRLVVGTYWEASCNPDYNAVTLSIDETTKHERSDAGDLRTDRGTMSRTLTLNMQYLTTDDRDHIYRILRGNGMAKPVFVTLAPGSSDIGEEQIFMLYGKLAKTSAIQYQYFNQFVTNVAVEEI